MNRNTDSHFSEVPYIDKPRSIFDRSFEHKTSFNVGELIPTFLDWVLPGDTFRVTSSKVVRLQTLLTPIMDNIEMDFYYFFVPMRLVWTHTREFFGENTTSAWVQSTPYRIPSISSPASTGFTTGSLADYFGLPIGVTWSASDRNAPSALPFRAYALICNEFFRDQNLSDPLNIPTGDTNQTGTNGTSYINDVANGGAPFKVAKYHDYFTSCLPNVLKAGAPVGINTGLSGVLPVIPQDTNWDLDTLGEYAITMRAHTYPNGTNNPTQPYLNWFLFRPGGASDGTLSSMAMNTGPLKQASSNVEQFNGADQKPAKLSAIPTASNQHWSMQPTNLGAVMGDAYANVRFTVNELRLAFQMQRYYEQLARGGSRYIEYMRNFYGVTSPDARLQRPEYLGGNRVPIVINQVNNEAQTNTDFLGDVGAYSLTSDINDDFEKSFTEFGFVIGLACARYSHTYGQGIERQWTRRDLFDQYVPTLAHIGEQPVYTYEIYADGYMNSDNVFGYNEAWSDYRYKPSRVSGQMRPGITSTLASWHLADYYESAPTLSDAWIREDKTNVDRTLAVTSTVGNQLFADFYFKNIVTRVMPMFSVPGLIDHF